MPIVTVQESSGRTLEQRSRALEAITNGFVEAYGISPDAVTVFFTSFADDHWGKAGRLRADGASVGNVHSDSEQ